MCTIRERESFHPYAGGGIRSERSDSEQNEGSDQLQFIGNQLEVNKKEGITRIYFQNLNGLKWDKEGGTWPMICHAMAGIHADIMGFAEVNQDTNKYEIQHKLQSVASKYFDHKRIIHGTIAKPSRRNYKPGGTMMMTVSDTVSAIKSTTRDRMGRWVSTQFQGNTPNKLTIIVAYQVCQSKRTGQNTAATQQINMILEEAVAQGNARRLNPHGPLFKI